MESASRSTQRVELLLTLLSENDEINGTNSNIFVFFFLLCVAVELLLLHVI